MTRLAFLGTPGAAVPTLAALAARFDVVLAITQPDRPRGRSGTPAPSPVKEAATRLGIPVAQPGDRTGIAAALGDARPLDLAVVVAYGRILDDAALETPRLGMLNVQVSLLPRWRGAAPVARAILEGDATTGVTIIRLDQGLDTGPVLTAQAIDVLPGETAGELTDRLAAAGAALLSGVLEDYASGELVPVPQSDEGVTYATKIEPGDRPIRVADPAHEAVRRVLALSPRPGATLSIDDVTHRVVRASLHPGQVDPGTWQAIDGSPVVGFVGGAVELVELQPPGKRTMTGSSWLAGRRRASGIVG